MNINEALLPKDEALVQNKEVTPIPAGHKLIMPSIDFLLPFAIDTNDPSNALVRSLAGARVNESRLRDFVLEHSAIYSALEAVVGSENMIVIQTSVISIKNGIAGETSANQDKTPYVPQEFPYLRSINKGWPRDAHTLIDGQIHAHKSYWTRDDEALLDSPLGIGGSVLVSGNAVITTPEVYRECKEKRVSVGKRKIVQVPSVLPQSQKFDFDETHIDGHLALVRGKSGKNGLFAARSYASQAKGVVARLRDAAQQIQAELFIVEDFPMPFLALNLVQFSDGTVVMTADAEELETKLKRFVGRDKVVTTPVPIDAIPESAGGGIRCLTNILPPLEWKSVA